MGALSIVQTAFLCFDNVICQVPSIYYLHVFFLHFSCITEVTLSMNWGSLFITFVSSCYVPVTQMCEVKKTSHKQHKRQWCFYVASLHEPQLFEANGTLMSDSPWITRVVTKKTWVQGGGNDESLFNFLVTNFPPSLSVSPRPSLSYLRMWAILTLWTSNPFNEKERKCPRE